MKKLNRKGFTLIELLAVIVILAIIVVVTVPTIISTISDARVQSLWNLAGETANSYDTAVAQDLLSPGTALQGLAAPADGSWKCIANITKTETVDGKSVTTTLADVLELKEADLALAKGFDGTTDASVVPSSKDTNGKYIIKKNSCSAIRLKNDGAGGAEVLLIAKNGGKFQVSGYTVYALSTETNGDKATVSTD